MQQLLAVAFFQTLLLLPFSTTNPIETLKCGSSVCSVTSMIFFPRFSLQLIKVCYCYLIDDFVFQRAKQPNLATSQEPSIPTMSNQPC